MPLKTIIVSIIVSVGLLLGMTLILSANDSGRSGEVSETSPIAGTDQTVIDLGTFKVAEAKQADFVIRNDGQEPLNISGMDSSCGCTKGQLIYQGKTSREFGMHAESGFLGAIAPGEEAMVRVIYRPYEMPVYGPVEREVSVRTNDPLLPKVTFKVTARIE